MSLLLRDAVRGKMHHLPHHLLSTLWSLRDAVRGKMHHLPHLLLSTLWLSRMLLRARDAQEKDQDSSNTHQT